LQKFVFYPEEIELKSQSNADIAKLPREEELKWYQRSKAQFILEGDSNTRYFHLLPMAGIGRNSFVLWYKKRARLKSMII
jgi:hypothetical protein